MSVIVITPPAPIITWAEADKHLRLDGDADQRAYVEGLVAVATAWLDGPTGRLGRSLGEQVLEAAFATCLAPAERRYPFPPFLALVSDTPQPDGRKTVVRWRAGYEAGKMPAPIRHAILLMVSHLFNNRDAVTTTAAQPATLPLGVEDLLSGFKVPRVG